MFQQSGGDIRAVSVRTLPDVHLGAGPSRVNNKQASYRYKKLTTVDIAAEYTVREQFPTCSAVFNLGILTVTVGGHPRTTTPTRIAR